MNKVVRTWVIQETKGLETTCAGGNLCQQVAILSICPTNMTL